MKKYNKKKVRIGIVFLCLILCSCSSNIQLTSLKEANYKIGKGSSELYMKDGSMYTVEQLYFTGLTTAFLNKETGLLMDVKTNAIQRITQKRHTAGAFKGAWIGGGIGAIGGIIRENDLKKNEGGGFAVAAGIVLGAAMGSAFGAAIGQDYTFYLPKTPDSLGTD